MKIRIFIHDKLIEPLTREEVRTLITIQNKRNEPGKDGKSQNY